MTNRERFLAVFQKRTPDVIPFVPDLTYYYGVLVPDLGYQYTGRKTGDATSAADAAARRFIEFHLKHHCIPYYQYQVNAFRPEYVNGLVVEETGEGDRQFCRFKLGSKSLVKISEYSAITHSTAPLKYPVETAADLELLLEIIPRTAWVDTTDRWDQMDALFGGEGYPICAAPRSPLPALLTDWAGIENTVLLLQDEPALCRDVMTAIDRANDRAFEILCRCRAPLIHLCDNLSGCVIAGWWDDWSADYYRRRVRQLHAAGKWCVTHLDGTLNGMITRLAQSSVDGIESITPAPVGDLTLEEVDRQLAGLDTIIWGGVPGAMFCPPFTWEAIRRQLDSLIALARQGRRVIAASADQVPPDGDIQLVRRIGEYLERGGADEPKSHPTDRRFPMKPIIHRPLSETQIRLFHDQGYLIVEDLIPTGDLQPVIDELNQEIDQRAHRLVAAGELSRTYAEEGFETRLAKISQETDKLALSIWNGVLHGPAIFHLITHPRLADVAEQLCGPELIASSVYRLRPKIPGYGMGEVPWHQDSGYFEPYCDNALVVTAWVPLVDATEENGCLWGIAGSHRLPVITHRLHQQGKYLGIDDQDLPAGNRICWPVRKGGVVLFTNRTVHGSFANRTQIVRWSMDLRYQSAALPTNAPITRLPGETVASPTHGIPAACYPPEADFLVRSQQRPHEVVRTPEQFRQLRSNHNPGPVTNRFGVQWAMPKVHLR